MQLQLPSRLQKSAKEGLGDNAVVWSIQSSQPLYAQAIATNEWITSHPELVNRFLKSLLQAEDFVINHPAEAKAIVKNQMNFSDAYTDKSMESEPIFSFT